MTKKQERELARLRAEKATLAVIARAVQKAADAIGRLGTNEQLDRVANREVLVEIAGKYDREARRLGDDIKALRRG